MLKVLALSFLVLIPKVYPLTPIKTPEHLNDDNFHPVVFVFIFGGLLAAAVYRYFLKVTRLPVPHVVFILITGMLLGVGAMHNEEVMAYCRIAETQPLHLMMSFLPVLVFKTAFCIDIHTFLKSWLQIAIISVPVVILTTCMTGLFLRFIINNNWDLSTGILFGALCTPIYPLEIVNLLKEIGSEIGSDTRHIGLLLEGESILGVASVILMHNIILGTMRGVITEWYHFILILLRFIGGGIVAGLIFGFVGSLFMRVVYNDEINVLLITLVFPFLSYYICAETLYISGVLCVLIIGIMMSQERTSLSSDINHFLVNFWETMAFIINTVIFLIVGVLFTETIITSMELQDYALVFVTYLVSNVSRFLSFFAFAAILSRIGYGMTFSNMIILVWGGLKSSVSLCLTLIIYHTPTSFQTGREFLMHIVGLFFLTLVINAPITPCLLRLMGMSEISMARLGNMNNCMKHVMAKRERAIVVLKMDRFLTDANWPMVHTATALKHPYQINISESDEEDDRFVGYKIATCPDCKKHIPNEPNPKELEEMTREARLRILKAKKISYSRQYENGMLSKEGTRILTQTVEIAIDTPTTLIELEGLFKLFTKENFSTKLRTLATKLFKTNAEEIKPPRLYWRRVCYRIVTHIGFEIFIYSVIALNVIQIVIELIVQAKTHSTESYCLKTFNTLFFLIYFTEFWLKIYAYSWVFVCKHGFKTYFRSYWNIFDFIVLLTNAVDVVFDFLDLFSDTFNKENSKMAQVTIATKLFRTVRFLKLIRLCKVCYPKLVHYWDSKIDQQKAFAYDIGKAYVTGEEEVLEILPYMIDHADIKDEMKKKLEEDRLAVTKELGLIQKDRPWIAITVKTKQAIRTVLNSMKDSINELKVSGWVDDVEYTKLMNSLSDRYKYVNSIKVVQPSPPKVIFQEVPWMTGDNEIIEFLYEHVSTRKFDPGEIVCEEGKPSLGIYIVVTGLLVLNYTPDKVALGNLEAYGQLPVVDYVNNLKFDEMATDYIVSGNCIGELSTLTGRPYNCTIRAETYSQVYILTTEVIKEAMAISPDPVSGLECRIWRSISIRIALNLLMEVPAYQGVTQDKLRYSLEQAFMPKISHYKAFIVNEMMEDVLLIEGVVLDNATRVTYTAPYYIPRTVQKILLPNNSLMQQFRNVEARLLIIPATDVDEYDIMIKEEEICQMISMTSSKCLQHLVQSKHSKKKRKKQGTMGIGRRGYNSNKNSRSTVDMSRRSTFPSEDSQFHETEVQAINMSDSSN